MYAESTAKLEAWERRAEWPLAGVALIFLTAYAVEVLAQPRGSTVELIIWASWLVFAVDYVVRLTLAPQRWRWFYRHLIDLMIVALPLLRPLRLVRLLILIKTLQKAAGSAIRGRVVLYTVSGAVLLVFVASLAVLDAERGAPGAYITDFGEALWWSVTTITTVGYGDLTPITTTGRVVAVLLMIGGITLVGSITATLASWIVERVSDDRAADHAVTTGHIREVLDEIDQLRTEVRRLSATPRDNTDG
ncbi:potassium channel family protein [Mycobacterium sp. MBM]|nr:potassium channel family protein [Mycobacterium sp. MBM]